MPAFLSAEWIELLQRTVAAVEVETPVRIEQIVTGGPEGEVRYAVSVGKPGGTAPDLTIELPYAVAVDLARGDVPPQDALSGGTIRVRGDVRRLPDAAAFADALASVRDQTTFA